MLFRGCLSPPLLRILLFISCGGFGGAAASAQALLPEDEPWNGAKIRPLPEIKEFLLANRQHGGKRGMNVITAMMMKAMSEGDM